MPHHAFIPSTPRLDELVAAVQLEGRSPFPVKEKKTTLFAYNWSVECSQVVGEVLNKVYTEGLYSTDIFLTDV
jgi:hypothetical protein